MIRKNKRMALIGDANFPNYASSEAKLGKMRMIAATLLKHSPSVIYLCPTKGVNLGLIPFFVINELKFRIVIPSKNFFSCLTKEDKKLFEVAAATADKIIVLDENECEPLRWFSDWEKANKKAIENSDWVMLVHNNEESSEGFAELIQTFKGNNKPVVAIDLSSGE